MPGADDGQMHRAALDTCLVVGCNLDSTLRYIGPSAAVVRTTSQPCSRPTCVCCLVHRRSAQIPRPFGYGLHRGSIPSLVPRIHTLSTRL